MIAYSCQDDEYISESEFDAQFTYERGFEGHKSTSVTNSDLVREAFGETLVEAMKNEPGLVEFLVNAIRKMQISDYEVLYLVEKDHMITPTKNFADIMTEYADPSVLTTFGNDFFRTNGKVDPLLSISIPDLDVKNLTKWKGDRIPDVATIYDNDLSKFNLFGADGSSTLVQMNSGDRLENLLSRITLSIMNAEGYYLVKKDLSLYGSEDGSLLDFMPQLPLRGGPLGPRGAGACEDIFREALLQFDIFEIDGDRYALMLHNQLIEEYLECIEDRDGGGGDGGSSNCDDYHLCERDCPLEVADETLVDFKVNSFTVFDAIRNQPFETRYKFHADIAYGIVEGSNAFGSTAQLVTKLYKKRDLLDCGPTPCEGRWKDVNYRIWRDWDLAELAEPYHVEWSEVDDSKVTVSVKIPFKVKFKLSDIITLETGIEPSISFEGEQTVRLGNQRVFYCDPILKENDTASVTFLSLIHI